MFTEFNSNSIYVSMYFEQSCYFFIQLINWRTLNRLVKIKMNLGIYLCWEIEWWKRELKYTERERNLSYYNQTHAIKNRNNITINQGLYSKLHILYLCLTHILSFAIRIELLPFVQYFFIFSSSFITQQKFFVSLTITKYFLLQNFVSMTSHTKLLHFITKWKKWFIFTIGNLNFHLNISHQSLNWTPDNESI